MSSVPSAGVAGKTYPDLTRSEEHEVRTCPRCCGCGREKERSEQTIGGLLCWTCFKYRPDCFKYWVNDTPQAGNLRAWLAAIGRPSLEEQGILPTQGGAA